MNYELEKLKKDYIEIQKLMNERRLISQEITDFILLHGRCRTEEERKNYDEKKRIVFKEIVDIQSKYDSLFKGIWYDTHGHSPFISFLLVLIRFLEQNKSGCCPSCDFYGDCIE